MKKQILFAASLLPTVLFAKLPSDWNSPPVSWKGARLALVCESSKLVSGPAKTMTPFDLAIVTSNDPRWHKGLFILQDSPAPHLPARYLSGYLNVQKDGDKLVYQDKDNEKFFELEVDLLNKTSSGQYSASLKSSKWEVELLCSDPE